MCGCINFDYLEVEVKDEGINMLGHSDIILDCGPLTEDKFKEVRATFNINNLPKGKRPVVIDMKTVGQSQWSYQLERKGPHPAYIIQIIIYTHILDCEYGMLIYENKDDSKLKCFKIDRNDEYWETIRWQAITMKEMVPSKKLPPPRPSRNSFECKNCPFKSLCHKSKIWKDDNLQSKREDFYKQLL